MISKETNFWPYAFNHPNPMGFIEQIIPGLLFKGRIDSVGLLLVIIMSVLTDSSPVCEICKIQK